jgi:hypothetical protein
MPPFVWLAHLTFETNQNKMSIDSERVTASEIELGWVIFLPKPRPIGENLKCKWDDSHCKKKCHLDSRAYGHLVTVVAVCTCTNRKIAISFVTVQQSTQFLYDFY